jgi:hypothetical protein
VTNCLDHTRRQKTLHYLRPSEAERRKDSTKYLMQLGLSTPTTVIQHGVKKERIHASSAKEVASAAPSELAPKRKKMKVLTHRPCYIEPATMPEFVGETSSATEAKEPTLLPNVEGPAKVPATEKIEEPRAEETKTSEILSPSARIEVPMQMPMTTPKRKRMVNVLDVLETIKSSSTAPKKIAETPKVQIEASGVEASKHQAETEAGPSEPAKVKSLEAEETETTEQILAEETSTAAPPKHFPKLSIIFYDMPRGKSWLKRKARGSVLCPKTEISKGGVDIQRQRRRRLLVLSP